MKLKILHCIHFFMIASMIGAPEKDMVISTSPERSNKMDRSIQKQSLQQLIEMPLPLNLRDFLKNPRLSPNENPRLSPNEIQGTFDLTPDQRDTMPTRSEIQKDYKSILGFGTVCFVGGFLIKFLQDLYLNNKQ
jgi:hypothetical protein